CRRSRAGASPGTAPPGSDRSTDRPRPPGPPRRPPGPPRTEPPRTPLAPRRGSGAPRRAPPRRWPSATRSRPAPAPPPPPPPRRPSRAPPPLRCPRRRRRLRERSFSTCRSPWVRSFLSPGRRGQELLAPQQAWTARVARPLSHPPVQHDPLTGCMASAVGLALGDRPHVRGAHVGMTGTIIPLQIRISYPDEPFLPRRRRLRLQLGAEAPHDPVDEALALRVPLQPAGLLVLAPEPLGGVDEEVVDVGGDLEVLEGAASLEHVAALAFEGPPDGHPDHLDEEVLAQDEPQDALRGGATPGGPSDVAKRVAAAAGSGRLGDVVLEHQAPRRRHGGLGLVQVLEIGR